MVYKTEQRKVLIDFFEHNKDKVFSASEIVDALKKDDISLSAVYRNLKDLENDGKVKKLAKAQSRVVYYQYVDCASCKGHMHLSCTNCGNIVHLPEQESEVLEKTILKNSHFNIDKSSTILYGVCEKCNKKKEK